MSLNRLGTFRQFEILSAVHRCGSISSAANELNLTQPTLSMQLKKLSDQNDVRLYNQIGKRLVFTEAGELYVRSARAILSEMARLKEGLDQLSGLTKGTLSLSVVTSAKYFIPHLLGPFCERYPSIEVKLKVGNRGQVIERMAMAEDDFYVFSHVPDLPDISSIEFLPNPLIPIASPKHPLASQKNLTLSDLAKYEFLLREEGSGTRHTIETYLAQHNQALNVRMTIESNEAIKHCVMANLGFSILSAHALSFGGDEGVVKLDVKGFPIPSQWSFVWPAEKSLSPIGNVFLRYTQEEGQDLLLKQLQG
jgi:DNA-binding transcriptional LysR family regulator